MRRMVAAGVVLAGLLAACGSGSSPTEILAATGEKLQEQGSARLDGTQTVSAGNAQIDTAIEGAVDFKATKAEMAMTMSGLPGGEQRLESLLDGTVLYMKFPPQLAASLGDKSWIKIDLQEAGAEMGVDFQALMQAGRQGDQAVQMLQGATDIEEAGTEEVRGVETTHYRYTIDMNKAVEEAPPELRESFQTVVDMGLEEAPGEAWIDEEGLPRRVAFEFTQQVQGQEMTQEMSFDYFDFGVEVDVQPPPASDVADASELTGAQP